MKRRLLFLAALMLTALPAFGQVSTTSVSGTISDANGQAFASGSWSAVLIAAAGGTGQPFVCNGITLSNAQVQQSGSLDSSGAFTATMVSNSCISPSGSLWQFTFVPAATSAPYNQSVYIFGTSQSLTSTITPPAITVNNSAVFTIAYTDAEVFGFKEGSFYWNVITPALRVYHNGAWQGIGGGGGGTPCTTTASSIQYDNAGAFGCVPDLTFDGTHTLTLGASGILTLTAGATVNGITVAMLPTGIPIANVGSAGLSGTTPITISSAGAIACSTCGVTTGNLSQFAATTSSQLAAVISDETGTGALVFANTPTMVSPVLGAATGTSLALGTAPAGCGTITGCIAFGEQATAGTPTAGTDYMRADSATHALLVSFNGGAETAIGSGSGTVTNIATSSPLGGGPITTTGTLTCATCTTNASALTSTAIMTGGGSQASQTPSATSTLSSGGNMSLAGTLTTGGTGAGAFVATQGAAQGHATANTVTLEAPAAVTAYEITLPAAAATGTPQWSNASSVVAESIDTNMTATAGALSLGASGTVGTVALGNATSGTVTLGTVAGALGGVTASLPANTGTIAELNLAQTFSATQTFGSIVPTGIAFSGSAPAVTTTGTTPYLAMNTLAQGTKNGCDWALTAQSANTATNLCGTVYTLPNAAIKWHFRCDGVWQVSASTTPTVTFGGTFSQAPTATGLIAGEIFTSNGTISTSPTELLASITSLSTGNNNIVAGQTITPAATYFKFSLYGWFTGSATSGTFSPTITVGTSASTWASTGSCQIW